MPVDLAELGARVPLPAEDARAAARDQLGRVAPPGAFDRLGELAEWLAAVQGQCPPAPPETTWLLAIAPRADEAVAGLTVLARTPHTEMLGQLHGTVPSVVVDALSVAPDGRADVPLSRDEAERAFTAGVTTATERIARYRPDVVVVVVVSPDAYVGAAALICVLTGSDIASVVGTRPSIDDREWMRRCAAARDAARVGRRVLADGGDVLDVVAASDSPEIAAAAGLMLQAAASRVPVLLDGAVTAAAALVVHRVKSRVARWMLAPHAAPDPGHAEALKKLRLSPLLDYGINTDDGTGPLVVVPHLHAAARLLLPMAGG